MNHRAWTPVAAALMLACTSAAPVRRETGCTPECEPAPPVCTYEDRLRRFNEVPELPQDAPGTGMRGAFELARQLFVDERFSEASDAFLTLYRQPPHHPEFLYAAWLAKFRVLGPDGSRELFRELCPLLNPCHVDYHTTLLRHEPQHVFPRGPDPSPRRLTCPPAREPTR